MSWFKSNYDKALLGGGALISVVLLYFGWSQSQLSGEEFSDHLMGGGKVNTGVDGAEEIDFAIQSMDLDHGLKQALTSEGRAVDLLTGIPLFIRRDSGGLAIDLVKSKPVHPPIPNEWWLQYDVDPGFADSPFQDPDADGFTNLEEFREGTHPKDADDHPPLITKLRYVEDKSVAWVLRPGFLSQDGSVPMRFKDGNNMANNAGAANPVKPGQLFFTNGVAQGRFKYLGHVERQQLNPAINVQETVIFARVEDQKANKAGKVYEIPAPLSQAKQGPFIQHDRSAVMKLEALGQGGKPLIIEENTHFSLPGGQKEKPFLLKSVTPEKIVVEYKDADGNTVPVEIPKGALPRL